MSRFFKILFGLIFIVIFSIWQYFFIKNTFDIDLLAKEILPGGFCKNCNVILISLDTLRAKSLPCYGYEKNTAPNLCEFASKSFLFKNAYSPASKTLDSHFSIFTSLYPSSHQMNIPFVSNLSDEIKTLTQVLKENGYRTLFSGPQSDPNLPLKRGLGKDFDFISYSSDPDGWIGNLSQSDLRGKKFFAFLHTYEVHEPYLPEKDNISNFYNSNIKEYITWDQLRKKVDQTVKVESYNYCNKFLSQSEFGNCYREQFDKYYESKMKTYWDTFKDMDVKIKKEFVQALYETKIYELDQKLARFFEFLRENDLLSKSIVIITADHGEEFNEHGGWVHSSTLYNEVIKVPLIVYMPNSKPRIVENLTNLIDIYPSILGLIGIPEPQNISGINLFSKKDRKYVLAEHAADNRQAIISKKWKLITNKSRGLNSVELYNIENDADEKLNLANDNPGIVVRLDNEMQKIKSNLPKFKVSSLQLFPTWINEEQRKKLIETGYF